MASNKIKEIFSLNGCVSKILIIVAWVIAIITILFSGYITYIKVVNAKALTSMFRYASYYKSLIIKPKVDKQGNIRTCLRSGIIPNPEKSQNISFSSVVCSKYPSAWGAPILIQPEGLKAFYWQFPQRSLNSNNNIMQFSIIYSILKACDVKTDARVCLAAYFEKEPKEIKLTELKTHTQSIKKIELTRLSNELEGKKIEIYAAYVYLQKTTSPPMIIYVMVPSGTPDMFYSEFKTFMKNLDFTEVEYKTLEK